ncbi:hypothetical protein CC2G_012371 [Coprinopsis cinerea AmutBmut pab1-1]|nr:hypothetical protein CC2G_012371 [Coprinopsis cinerea AmutBmut pab1-1]
MNEACYSSEREISSCSETQFDIDVDRLHPGILLSLTPTTTTPTRSLEYLGTQPTRPTMKFFAVVVLALATAVMAAPTPLDNSNLVGREAAVEAREALPCRAPRGPPCW